MSAQASTQRGRRRRPPQAIECSVCKEVQLPTAFSNRQRSRCEGAVCRWCSEQARPAAAGEAVPKQVKNEASAAAGDVAPATIEVSEANAASRAEEREALAAIFGEACRVDGDRISLPLELRGGDDEDSLFGAGDAVALVLALPPGYPGDEAPAFDFEFATRERVPSGASDRLRAAVAEAVEASVGDASAFTAWSAANDALSDEIGRYAEEVTRASEDVDAASLSSAPLRAGNG